MLRPYSHMIVADNSGAKEVRIITVLTNNKHQVGHVGDKCVVTVKKAAPNAAVIKGAVVKCVIVRTKREVRRADGSLVRFDQNAAVLIDDDGNPRGTRIFGPVCRELRDKGYLKITSLAPEVV